MTHGQRKRTSKSGLTDKDIKEKEKRYRESEGRKEKSDQARRAD